MNEEERRRALELAVYAIEDYLNANEDELVNNHEFTMTSDYLLLDALKNELAKEAFGK